MYWTPIKQQLCDTSFKIRLGENINLKNCTLIEQRGLHHCLEMLKSSEMLSDSLLPGSKCFIWRTVGKFSVLSCFFSGEDYRSQGENLHVRKAMISLRWKMFRFLIRYEGFHNMFGKAFFQPHQVLHLCWSHFNLLLMLNLQSRQSATLPLNSISWTFHFFVVGNSTYWTHAKLTPVWTWGLYQVLVCRQPTDPLSVYSAQPHRLPSAGQLGNERDFQPEHQHFFLRAREDSSHLWIT